MDGSGEDELCLLLIHKCQEGGAGEKREFGKQNEEEEGKRGGSRHLDEISYGKHGLQKTIHFRRRTSH